MTIRLVAFLTPIVVHQDGGDQAAMHAAWIGLQKVAHATHVGVDMAHQPPTDPLVSRTAGSIVVSANTTPAGIRFVAVAVREMTLSCLRQGTWTRGAITVGEAEHTSELFVGPAAVEARALATIERLPRIVVTSVAEELLCSLGTCSLADPDGAQFLDLFCASEPRDLAEIERILERQADGSGQRWLMARVRAAQSAVASGTVLRLLRGRVLS